MPQLWQYPTRCPACGLCMYSVHCTLFLAYYIPQTGNLPLIEVLIKKNVSGIVPSQISQSGCTFSRDDR